MLRANPVINSLGRYQFGGDFFDNAGAAGSVVTGQNPRICQLSLTLSAADQLKTLSSISVTNAGTASTALTNAGALVLGAMSLGSGTLTVNAGGTITQSGGTGVVQGAALAFVQVRRGADADDHVLVAPVLGPVQLREPPAA